MSGWDYRKAGVDIAAGNRAVQLMRQSVRSTFRPEVLGDLGGFGGLFALQAGRYREPVLVAGTDGVGTKLKLAFLQDRHNSVGIDCVAMCVNDLLVQGAEPLFFLDYLAVGRMVPEQVAAVVEGVAEGCRQAGCALIGGETAEMPGFYPPGEYDLAGFAVGVVERAKLVEGSRTSAGDVVLGLASSGLHSNGFSLARQVLLQEAGLRLEEIPAGLEQPLGEEMLKPTRIYVKSVLPLLDSLPVHGMAHITGGGLLENIPRSLSPHLDAVLDQSTWTVPPIFRLIREKGGVAEDEMYRAFNMGIGYVLLVPPQAADEAEARLVGAGETVYRIGRLEPGSGMVRLERRGE